MLAVIAIVCVCVCVCVCLCVGSLFFLCSPPCTFYLLLKKRELAVLLCGQDVM